MFFGSYAENPTEFTFSGGEVDLIKKLVCHVKQVVDCNGKNAGLKHFKTDTEPQTNFQPGKFFSDIISKTVADKCTHTEDLSSPELTTTNAFLNKLIETAKRNAPRNKNGYRYDSDMKSFACYLRMLAGPFAYDTLQRNLEEAMPTLSAVNKYIASKESNRIDEGVLRSKDLLDYLQTRHLPLVVSLSEDAARIVGRIQYDSKQNLIKGFVLPINQENGMPIPFSYKARNIAEILHHFSADNSIAQFVNVVMAQPLVDVPPFCLLIFSTNSKYTATNVCDRWQYIPEELKKLNITVLSISSDSDPKYNAAMRRMSLLGATSNLFEENCWFTYGGTSPLNCPFYVQDTVHIATKMRNFLLKTAFKPKTLQFGKKYFICSNHIKYLLENYPKDQHQLTATVLNPLDKQNFGSVLRMCDKKVISLLKCHVKDSEATVNYLEILKDIIDAFTQPDLKPLERVKKMWDAVFTLRIWREYVMSNKKLTLKQNFLTANCYSCVEFNAHSLICILLYLKDNNMEYALRPHLMSSQPCEAFFRKVRSFTYTYSTVANCSVKEILSRIEKIQFQSDISLNKNFVFPRMTKTNTENLFELPTKEQIIKEIEKCKQNVIQSAIKIGLISESKARNYSFDCKIESRAPKLETSKQDFVVDTNNQKLKSDCSLNLSTIMLKNFSEKFVNKEINETSPYVEIFRDKKRIIVKKSSLCWLLRKEAQKLSCDRLLRVRSIYNPEKNCTRAKQAIKTSKSLYNPYN